MLLPESSCLVEAAGLVHFLGGFEEGVVTGGNDNFAEAAGFEAAEDFEDLLPAEAPALEFRQDAVVANYGQLGALPGIVAGHADGFAVEAGYEGAGADGVGIVESLEVSVAEVVL